MIIYKDLLTDKEMFCDAYPMTDDDFIICVEGKRTIKKGEGISASLIGGNPSQEEEQEECCDTESEESGIDVAMHYKLDDISDTIFPTKKSLATYLKKFVKKVADTLKDNGEEEQLAKFKKGMAEHFTDFVNKYEKDASVFVTPEFNYDEFKHAPMIGIWSDDGQSCKMYAMKLCLQEEKC